MINMPKIKGCGPVGLALALLLATGAGGRASAQQPAPALDLRVLIDVSGSMKRNDPHNLRAPALRLLVELLPHGTRAGVWTFAESVHMPVAHARVTGQWQRHARDVSRRIHSRGQRTDIEAALRQATFDWQQSDAQSGRYLILLTDGMVDVAAGEDPRDAASRRRIVEELLPTLRASGVTVHAVALSEHADHTLLDRLARATDGWYEKAESADALNRIFLRLFQQSVPVEGLPLVDNRFRVDDSIEDMTVVAFRAAKRPARLIPPDGEPLTAKTHPESVRWHAEPGYDMVTVQRPTAGQWQIDGARDPDNRVLVVTNLGLGMEPVPNHLVVGGELALRAWLLRDGESLVDPDFLELATFTLERRSEAGAVVTAGLHDDARDPDVRADDGVYSLKVDSELEPGRYELLVRAHGKTFGREQRHLLRVHASPVQVRIVEPDAEGAGYRVAVTPEPELLVDSGASLTARLPTGEVVAVERTQPAGWMVRPSPGAGGQELVLRVEGQSPDGRAVVSTLRRTLPPLSAPAGDAQSQGAPAPEEVDWLWVAFVVALVNLLVLGVLVGGYFGWQWWRKRGSQPAEPAEVPADG